MVHLLSACSSNTHTMHRSGLVPVRYKLYYDLFSSVLLLALFSSALLQLLALLCPTLPGRPPACSDVLMGLMCTRALWPRAQSDMLHVIAFAFALHMAHVYYHVKHVCITLLKIWPFMCKIMWIIFFPYKCSVNHIPKTLLASAILLMLPCPLHIINFSATSQRGHYF